MNFLDPFFLDVIASKVNGHAHKHSWDQSQLPDHRKFDNVKQFYNKGKYYGKSQQKKIEESTPVDPQKRLTQWKRMAGRINHPKFSRDVYHFDNDRIHHVIKGHPDVSMNDVASAMANPDKVTSGYEANGAYGKHPKYQRTYFYKKIGTYNNGKPFHIKVATAPFWGDKDKNKKIHKVLTAHPVSSTHNEHETPVDYAGITNAADHNGHKL